MVGLAGERPVPVLRRCGGPARLHQRRGPLGPALLELGRCCARLPNGGIHDGNLCTRRLHELRRLCAQRAHPALLGDELSLRGTQRLQAAVPYPRQVVQQPDAVGEVTGVRHTGQ